MATLLWALLLVNGLAGSAWATGEVGGMPSYTIVSMTGERVPLHERRGKVTLLNIWATWCGPCRKEMPLLQQVYRGFHDRGLDVLGVNVDASQADQQKRIQELIARLGIEYEILLDPDQQFMRTFRAIGVPQTLLLDRSGQVVRHWRGAFDPTAPDVVTLIERALSQVP